MNLTKRLIFVDIFLVFFISFSAHSEELIKGWVPTYVEPIYTVSCDKDVHEMALCAEKAMDHSGKFLKELIKAIAKIIPEEQSTVFNKSNDLWFQFRDASCEFDAATAGGNSKNMRFRACVHSYNKARIDLLDKYRYCISGGDCPNDLHLYYFLGS